MAAWMQNRMSGWCGAGTSDGLAGIEAGPVTSDSLAV